MARTVAQRGLVLLAPFSISLSSCRGVAHSHLTNVSLANCSPLCRVSCRFPGRAWQTNQGYKTAYSWTAVAACTRDADRHRQSAHRHVPDGLCFGRQRPVRAHQGRRQRSRLSVHVSRSSPSIRPGSRTLSPSQKTRRSSQNPRIPGLTRVLAVPALPGGETAPMAEGRCVVSESLCRVFLSFSSSFPFSGVQVGKDRAKVRLRVLDLGTFFDGYTHYMGYVLGCMLPEKAHRTQYY